MDYRVIKHFRKIEIQIGSEGKKITDIVNSSLFSFDATFHLMSNSYEISAVGISKSKFEVKKNNSEIGDIEFKWNGTVIIRLRNTDGITKHFLLSKKNFKLRYELRDFLTNYLYNIQSKWNWSQFKTNYHFIKEEGFLHEENKVNEEELVSMTSFALIVLKKKQAAMAAS